MNKNNFFASDNNITTPNLPKSTESNDIFSNISKKTNEANINLIYEINYLVYKKKLVKNMTDDINMIINFFTEDISDIIINILILKKKNKVTEDDLNISIPIYNVIEILNNIDFFDQEDFLILIINFFGIYTLCDDINIFSENFKFKDIVNILLFTSKVNELFVILSKRNGLLKMLDLITKSNINNNELNFILKGISIDYFMYYSANNIYNKILNTFIRIFKNILVHDTTKHKFPYEKFLINFKNYKDIFSQEYNHHYEKHTNIYSEHEIELKIKFKLKKNKEYVNKLVENLNFIKNIE